MAFRIQENNCPAKNAGQGRWRRARRSGAQMRSAGADVDMGGRRRRRRVQARTQLGGLAPAKKRGPRRDRAFCRILGLRRVILRQHFEVHMDFFAKILICPRSQIHKILIVKHIFHIKFTVGNRILYFQYSVG